MTAEPEKEVWTDLIWMLALWPLLLLPVLFKRNPLHWRRVIVATALWAGLGAWVWLKAGAS